MTVEKVGDAGAASATPEVVGVKIK